MADSQPLSALGQAADDYLRLRRGLGHKLDEAGRLLPRFVAYLEAIGAPTVTVAAALAWATGPGVDPASSVPGRRMALARGFARHMSGIDAATEVPPAGLLAPRQRRRTPYLFSTCEVAALVTQAGATIPSPLRAATFQTLIGLLAVTGLRIGEAIRLNRADVDLGAGLLTVYHSKFGKSREVPLHASTVEALSAYACRRDELVSRPTQPSFFVSTVGTRLIYENVQVTFRKLVDGAGIAAGCPLRPRIHDLRHSFAVATLVDWYRDGVDVDARLPRLSTYLGHRDPCSTYWYLSAAPELLALAASRLQAFQQGQG